MIRKHFTILMVLAFLVRLPMLFDRLWYDENFTLAVVRLPFARMLAAIAGDVHPPLWYVIAWPFGHWGGPGWLIRMPALLFGLASLVVLRAVLPKLGVSQKAKPVALMLMAFAPMQLHYDTEARMYSLLVLLVLCSLWAVLYQHWGLAWLAITAMLYTHNWGLFYAFTLGVFALIDLAQLLYKFRNYSVETYATKRLGPIVLTFGLALVAWLPWLVVMLNQMHTLAGAYWITRVSPGQLAYYIFQQVWSVALPNPLGFMVLWGWLILGVIAAWHFYFWCWRISWRIYLFAFGPLLVGVVVSLIWQPVIIFRALIGVSPFVYILLAAPAEWIYDRAPRYSDQPIIWRRALVAAIFITPLIILAYPNMYKADYRGNNTVAVADYLSAHMRPGDLVVVGGDGGMLNLLPFGYAPIMIPECAPTLSSLSPATRAALGFDIRPWDAIRAQRIWLFWGTTALQRQCGADQYRAVIGDAKPALTVEDDGLTYTALWLVEK